jgi:hypothetical protein
MLANSPLAFAGQLNNFGKLMFCIVMTAGRHRGMPSDIDNSVTIPTEKKIDKMNAVITQLPKSRLVCNSLTMLVFKMTFSDSRDDGEDMVIIWQRCVGDDHDSDLSSYQNLYITGEHPLADIFLLKNLHFQIPKTQALKKVKTQQQQHQETVLKFHQMIQVNLEMLMLRLMLVL